MGSPAMPMVLDKLTEIPIKGFPVTSNDTPNESPSSGVSTLPTPDVNESKWIAVHTSEWAPEGDRAQITAPGAPRMRDLDSFTEGTGKGSFDSIPADITNEFGEYILQPDSFSLGLLPEINTSHFIETWRVDVYNAEVETEEYRDRIYMDALDAANTLSEISLGLYGSEDLLDWPRIGIDMTTSSPVLVTAPVPCNPKRARSSTPDPARRMRRRSNSRLSLRSVINRFDLTSIPFLSAPPVINPTVSDSYLPHDVLSPVDAFPPD